MGLTIEIIVFTGQLDGPFGVIEYNSAFIAKECHVIALDGTAIEVNFGSLYLIRLFLGFIVVSASCQCDAKHDDQEKEISLFHCDVVCIEVFLIVHDVI